MIWLRKNIERIDQLQNEGTERSLTYAALECRLAIEQVCYDRLRNAHKYISHSDIKKWQPKDVVQQLIQDVDKNAASTFTLSMSKEPIVDSNREFNQGDFEEIEYVLIGTQIGFDPKKLGKLWNALSNFLHVKIPKNEEMSVDAYSDPQKIKEKVGEAIDELRRLSEGTLISIGSGQIISFECYCGSLNKRMADQLRHGDRVSCINPECVECWDFQIENEENKFVRRKISVYCKSCGEENCFAEKTILSIGLNKSAHFNCECGEINYVRWALQGEARVKANENNKME